MQSLALALPFAGVLLCLASATTSAETMAERLFNNDMREMQRQSQERERQMQRQIFGSPAQPERKCTYVPVRGYVDEQQKVTKPGWQTVYIRRCK